MTRWWTVVLLLCPGLAVAQQNNFDACAFASAKSGQVITVRGKIGQAPHDMLLLVSNCKAVVLVYPDSADRYNSETSYPASRVELKRDSNFKKFDRYTRAEDRHLPGGGRCIGCPKYEIEATFTGSLRIAIVPKGLTRNSSGFLWDASGKLVGMAGFGHPTPMFEYLMVLESVSEVVARKLPKPTPASKP